MDTPFTSMEFLLQQTQIISGGITTGLTPMSSPLILITPLENTLSLSTDLKIAVMEHSISNTESIPTSVLIMNAHKVKFVHSLNQDIMILVIWTFLVPMMNSLLSSKVLSKVPTKKIVITVLEPTQISQSRMKTCVEETLNTSSGDSISTSLMPNLEISNFS